MDEPIKTSPPPVAANAEFTHTPVENVSSVAECAFFPEVALPKKPSGAEQRILSAALDPKILKRSLDTVSQLDLNSRADVRPSQFGDHLPIDREAVMEIAVLAETENVPVIKSGVLVDYVKHLILEPQKGE